MTPELNTVDWIIVAVVLGSVLLGLLRGVTREILSLAGWIVGLGLAFLYAEPLGAALPFDVPVPAMRTALGAILILAGTLIVAALLGALLRALMAAVRLSTFDRLLGGAFGLARAALVLGLAVWLAGATQMPKAAWWKESVLLPWLEAGVAFAQPWLPESLARAQHGHGR